MENYISEFSGQHTDGYDERITTLLNTISEQQSTIISLTNKLNILESNFNTLESNFNTLNNKFYFFNINKVKFSSHDSVVTLEYESSPKTADIPSRSIDFRSSRIDIYTDSGGGWSSPAIIS